MPLRWPILKSILAKSLTPAVRRAANSIQQISRSPAEKMYLLESFYLPERVLTSLNSRGLHGKQYKLGMQKNTIK